VLSVQTKIHVAFRAVKRLTWKPGCFKHAGKTKGISNVQELFKCVFFRSSLEPNHWRITDILFYDITLSCRVINSLDSVTTCLYYAVICKMLAAGVRCFMKALRKDTKHKVRTVRDVLQRSSKAFLSIFQTVWSLNELSSPRAFSLVLQCYESLKT